MITCRKEELRKLRLELAKKQRLVSKQGQLNRQASKGRQGWLSKGG